MINPTRKVIDPKIIEDNKTPTIDKDVIELKRLAAKNNDIEFTNATKRIEIKAKQLQNFANEQAYNSRIIEKEIIQVNEELQTTKEQVAILENRVNITVEEVVDAMHLIKSYADAVDSLVDEVISEPQIQSMENIFLTERMSDVRQACHKIVNTYNLLLHTEYYVNTDKKQNNIASFIETYIECEWRVQSYSKIEIEVKKQQLNDFSVKFNPLEFSVVIDNIIANAKKAKATHLTITITKEDDGQILISFLDDGVGIHKSITDFDRIFEPGYTKTNGTGLGLYNVRKYIKKLNGDVKINKDLNAGFELNVRLKV